MSMNFWSSLLSLQSNWDYRPAPSLLARINTFKDHLITCFLMVIESYVIFLKKSLWEVLICKANKRSASWAKGHQQHPVGDPVPQDWKGTHWNIHEQNWTKEQRDRWVTWLVRTSWLLSSMKYSETQIQDKGSYFVEIRYCHTTSYVHVAKDFCIVDYFLGLMSSPASTHLSTGKMFHKAPIPFQKFIQGWNTVYE